MHTIDDFASILLNDTPLIDTRAPVEFAKGSLPTAVNLPLMSDSEREQVGTCYKRHGQDAAIALGHQLVSGEIKAQRIAAWCHFIEANPQAALFCFRGGLRSAIAQRWLADTGLEVPRVTGGYKALRRWLIEQLESLIADTELLVIGGRTGCAKTALINSGCDGQPLPGSVDLEGLANHRGSAFGRRPGGQPAQISFEMAVAVALLKVRSNQRGPIILEDEGRLIGRCALPDTLWRAIKSAPLILLEASLESRIEHSFHNYILANLAEQLQHSPDHEAAFTQFADGLRLAMKNISRRLGGARYQHLSGLLESALRAHRDHDDPSQHREWIGLLLAEYYDPMYDYQLKERLSLVKLRGDATTLTTALCCD